MIFLQGRLSVHCEIAVLSGINTYWPLKISIVMWILVQSNTPVCVNCCTSWLLLARTVCTVHYRLPWLLITRNVLSMHIMLTSERFLQVSAALQVVLNFWDIIFENCFGSFFLSGHIHILPYWIRQDPQMSLDIRLDPDSPLWTTSSYKYLWHYILF